MVYICVCFLCRVKLLEEESDRIYNFVLPPAPGWVMDGIANVLERGKVNQVSIVKSFTKAMPPLAITTALR